MAEENVSTGEPATVLTSEGTGPLTIEQATDAIVKARGASLTPDEEAPPVITEVKTEEAPPAEEESAAPPEEEAPGETTQEAEPVEELPPLEPPRSWSKEDKTAFEALPRETQERIVEKERARDTDLNRRQQEATERAKAAEAERLKAAQARQQYEQALPQLLAQAQTAFGTEFADIKSWADVEKMQSEDFLRYQRFEIARGKTAALKQQAAAIAQRQAQDTASRWDQFVREEDAKIAAKIPDLADKQKTQALRASTEKLMEDLGFTKDEMSQAWNGHTGVSMRDARVQELIYKATQFDAMKARAAEVRAKPVPPVQKPGTVRPTASKDAEIKALEKQLDKAHGKKAIELGTRIHQLRRSS
jgi:hypothetical protein